MELFTQKEIILMIGVVSVLLICITILTILDIREYLKAKKEVINEDINFGEEYHEEEKELAKVEVMEVEEKNQASEILLNDLNEEDNYHDDILLEEIEDEKLDTLNMVSEEEIMPQIEETSLKEKKRLELFEELDEIDNNLPNNKDDITNFEMEQERTAIISLDELLKKSDELYNDNEIVQYDDGDEPITIDEIMNRYNKENTKESIILEEKEVPEVMQNVLEEKVEPYSRKETIPFISSVYGIEKKDNALEFENTATYEKLDRQNYNDFIAQLREMNENK